MSLTLLATKIEHLISPKISKMAFICRFLLIFQTKDDLTLSKISNNSLQSSKGILPSLGPASGGDFEYLSIDRRIALDARCFALGLSASEGSF